MSNNGVDVLRIAARVAVPEACPVCGTLMLYDDGRDAYTCDCGFAEANGPTSAENLEKVAAAIAARPAGGMNCTASLSVSIDFEGSVSNQSLTKKLKSELLLAVKSAVEITGKEFQLKVVEVRAEPPSVDIVSIPINES